MDRESNMLKYIGIDLGQKGSVTVQSILSQQKPVFTVHPFWGHFGGTRLRTLMDHEYYTLFEEILRNAGETFIAIEHPVLMPKNGSKAVSSMFEKFGLLKGILMGLGATAIWEPTPRQWQSVAKAGGKDKIKGLRQANLMTRHPNLNELTADSVLISEACRLHYR